ncbi:MAG: rRNA maturation RNase YbeY, partial [Bacteroidia bacterium]|nr:rRNA maturation RNase YbeY [Bacteroidia bacterium]
MNENQIQFFYEDIAYQIKGKRNLRRGIDQLVREKEHQLGTVNIVFCSDKFLKAYNKRYLNHDYFTDVITFDFSDEESVITGDIYISLDRVRENAKTYKVMLYKEIVRIIIHGILQLM